jgi:predicted ArsR family transcriptional regulator
MTTRPGGPATRQLDSAPRGRLLQLLRDNTVGLDGHELAAAVGLHISTVRFHLDQLLAAGQITAASRARSTPGRPRTVYAAVVQPLGLGQDGYQGLAALLAAHLAGSPRARRRRAETAGAAWAQTLLPAPSRPPAAAEATQQVTALLTRMNFQPEFDESDEEVREIRLRGCPYREVARDQPDVVCAVHLGMLRGAFHQLGQSGSVNLTPFVETDLCTVHLGVESSRAAAEPEPT